MLELMQKGLCNNFLAKICPFDSNFTFQGHWLSFLFNFNVTGFGTIFTKLKYLGHVLAWKFIFCNIFIAKQGT